MKYIININQLKETIFAIILLLCFVRIDYFSEHLGMYNLYNLLSFSAIAILGILILYHKKIKYKAIIFCVAFIGYLTVLSFINNKNIYSLLSTFSGPFGLCLMAFYYLENNKKRVFLNAFMFLDIIIYINFILILIFPNGMYSTSLYTDNWLLGYKNPQIRLMIPVLGISLIRDIENDGHISHSSIALFVCCVITMLIVSCSTGILAIFIFGLIIYFLYISNKHFSVNNMLFKSVILIMLLNIGIVIFGIQSWFENLFLILGKDSNLTGRPILYKESINQILAHPIFGMGFLSGNDFVNIYHLPAAYHPHNYFLYILMQGGLILLSILLLGVLSCSRQISKNESSICDIIGVVIIVYLIIGFSEALTGNNFLYMYIIMGIYGSNFTSNSLKHNRIKFRL